MDLAAPTQGHAPSGGREAGRPAWMPLGMTAAVLVALAPAVGGGWLDYDDGWLVRDNPVLGSGGVDALGSIWFDFSTPTRLTLGAEYLPVRDVVVWLAFGVLRAPVWALHLVQIALYTLGALLFRRWLLVAFGASPATELAAWLFALHPVHVEAAAWLASMKDVLLLALVGGALHLWASGSARQRSLAVALGLAACFAKSAGVVVPALFVVSDLTMRRAIDLRRVGVAVILCALALGLHAHVGGVVGMLAEPIGGSRAVTAASMMVVAWRYLALCAGVGAHSIVYEVDALAPTSPSVILAALGLATATAAAFALWRRDVRWPLAAVLLFAIALAPVSQVLAPLQNRMADRYLLLAAIGPCLGIAHGAMAVATRLGGQLPQIVATGLSTCAGVLMLVRAMTFSSPIALFTEATERTTTSTVAPYQLALSLEAAGRDDEAELAYRLTIARDGLRTDEGRRGGNNLARLLARRGRVSESIAMYRDLRDRFPDDPRVLRNLAVLLEATDQREEAQRLRAELAERFPDYERTRLEPHVGP